MRKIINIFSNFFNKIKYSKYRNTKFVKFAPIIIICTIIGIGFLFNYLFNTYDVVITTDSDGYFIGTNASPENLKSSFFDKAEDHLNTTNVKENDYIYKTPLNHYVDNKKKSSVNIDYPLFINNGLSIINYNENTNLIDKDLTRLTGFSDVIFSYGSMYNILTYDKVDDERYLLLNYENGIYINLFDLEITTESEKIVVPLNSFIYFSKNEVNFYKRSDDTFVKEKIEGLNERSTIRFYYEGLDEEYVFNFEDFLENIGLLFKTKEKLPDEPILTEDDVIEEVVPVQDEESIEESIQSEESKEEEPATNPEFVYVKPSVKVEKFVPNVYSMTSELIINDPSKVIVKAPTFTLEVNGKVYARRAFYTSGKILIGGLSASTEFKIVGQYTYLDEDLKTKKIATFYSDSITTLGLDALDPIDISFTNGKIYSKKMELATLKITSDLESEALRGVKSFAITINGVDYFLPKSDLNKLINGKELTEVSISESLVSDTEYDFEINFYDGKGNKLETLNNKGHTRTSRKPPTVVLRVIKNEVDYITVGVDLKNDDNIDINNYRYVVKNSSGSLIKQGPINSNQLKFTNLDPNQMFTISVLGDFDLNDGSGLQKDYEIGSMNFTSLPITSLGFLNFSISQEDLTKDSVVLKYTINQNKTDARLLILLKSLHFSLYRVDNNEKVKEYSLSDDEIELVKNGSELTLYFKNLSSNTQYFLKAESVVKQGESSYNLDCIHDLRPFETRKKPASVVVDSFTTNNMIDLDVKVNDPDHTVLTDEVRVELRDLSDNLLDARIIKTNTDFIQITYNNLKVNTNYIIKFIADEYNETNNYSTFQAKYVLAKINKFTEEGISGKIELTSSTRVANGTNLVDMESETKWIQTNDYYTIPKTMDEEGDMHIYSKTGAASYMYDLSDYHGEIVTASFKIKAITPLSTGYRIFFENYLGNTTNLSYGFELAGISTTKWTTFTYTFRVGSYKSGKHFVDNKSTYYGKYRTDFIGFYITNGNKFTAEYEIRDFQVYKSRKRKSVDLTNYSIEKGTYNSNGSDNNTSTYIDSRARLSDALILEGDKNYTFDFGNDDSNYSAYIYFTDMNNKYKSAYGWFEPGRTVYVPKDSKTYIAFRYYSGNINIDPNDVKLKVTQYDELGSFPYEKFKYDFVTKVRVNLKDLRNEISNNTYYISVCDEDNQELYRQAYTELVNTDNIIDEIKQISLEEKKNYTVKLIIIARNREYVLDSFDISTDSEVKGISTRNDWAYMQPNGNYIVLNDLDFYEYTGQHLGYGYKYFYGIIDFQGYSANIYSMTDRNNFQRLGRITKSGVLKNMVLNVHINNTINSNSTRGFVSSNYGTIENVEINVYDERETKFNDYYINTLVDTNQSSGVIRNFTLNLKTDVNLYYDSGLLTRLNYGKIDNGYIVGKDAYITNEHSGASARLVGLLQRYGGSQSSVEHVYVVSNINFPNDYDYDKTGLLAYETYGKVKNVYTVGNVNNRFQSVGPILGYVRATAEFENAYYMSNAVYTTNNQNKITELNINDATFQKSVLGDGFNVDEMIKLGYYPQVKYTYNKMPKQAYKELPYYSGSSNVEIITMEVTEHTNSTAKVSVVANNPDGDSITGIAISDVRTRIVSQIYENGKSYITLNISDPEIFVSKYAVRSISSKSYTGLTSTRGYNAGEKYLYVDFYNEIDSVEDWISIKQKNNQNFAIMKDLNFREYANYNISSTSGKIEGNNHVLKNIDITSGDGLITRVYGTIQNIRFENITKTSNTTNTGLFGRSDNVAKFDNVHVKNITVTVPANRTTDTVYAGGLVGYMYYSKVSNCSLTNVNIISEAIITGVYAGGMVGYSSGSGFNNVFVQNVNINISKAKSVLGVGGIVGLEDSGVANITNAFSTGRIFSNGYRVGGIVGSTAGYVENTYSKVNIQSDIDSIAGIAGRSSNPSYILNNIYLGNMYSKVDNAIFGRIISNNNLADESHNYAYRESLINGVKTSEFDIETDSGSLYGAKVPIGRNETLVSTEDLKEPENYTNNEMFRLGDAFDYSQVANGIMPKIYYLDTNTLLPGQEDVLIEAELFNVVDIAVEKHAQYATIALYLENPNGYTITGLEMEDINITIPENGIKNESGLTIINFEATPEKFYDSYKINKIYYKVNASDENAIPVEKSIRIPMIFYQDLFTIEDWERVSTTDAQNYVLKNDIDFTGRTFKKGLVFNRLETPSSSEVYTLKGMRWIENASGPNRAIISKIVTSLKNINFEDIKITNNQTSGNDYMNIISYNYGQMKNLKFKDIEINTPSKNRVAIVGRGFTNNVDKITLENITVKGKAYVSGFMAYYENGVNNKMVDITADNLNITGTGNYVGGLFTNFSGATGVDPKPKTNIVDDPDMEYSKNLIRNITVKNSNITGGGTYTGGIGAYAASNDSVVDNTTVKGYERVGGAFGYSLETNTYNITVKNSTVEGTYRYIGGISGNSRDLNDCLVDKTTVEGKNTTTTGVGGLTGLMDGYTLRRNVVKDSKVINNGNNTGGIAGHMTGGTISHSTFHNGTVTGQTNTGGAIGNMNNGTAQILKVTDSIVDSVGNYAGGILGYFNNVNNSATYREGNMRAWLVGGTSISSSNYAGGLIGGKNTEIYNKNNDYELYFEGNVTTRDGNTAGVGAGDGSNKEMINLGRVGFYNKSTVNNQSIENNIARENSYEMIGEKYHGFVNTTTGEPEMNYNYPDAEYTEMIKLEQGKTYHLKAENVNHASADIFRIRLYDAKQKYLENIGWTSNSWYYFNQYFNLSYIDEYTFTVNHDCYIRIVFFYRANATLYEVNTEYNRIPESKMLSASDIRDRGIWARYTYADVDLYHQSKLYFSNDSWDFTPLNSRVESFNVEDRSGNGYNGSADVSEIHYDKGMYFDGKNDKILIDNFVPSSNITVSTTFTSYSSRSWQLLFSYGNSSTRYFGVFISGKNVYVVINNSTYNTGYAVPHYRETSVTATYDSNKYLKVYVDGNLIYTHNSVNKTIGTASNAKTYIGHDLNYSSTSYKFIGFIKNMAVFNRALSAEEVLNNYDSAGITNTTGLKLLHNYNDSRYESVGNYPIHKTSTAKVKVYNQTLTKLPTDVSVNGYQEIMGSKAFTSLYNAKLKGNYHVYSSGINTINLEFDKISNDLKFDYKIGNKEAQNISVKQRVYSFSYDYNSNIEFTIKNLNEEKTIKFSAKDLAKTILINNGKYYHITDGNLYENDNLLIKDVVNLKNNLALLKTGEIYNIGSKEKHNSLIEEGLLAREIPLYESNLDGKVVSSFYSFSRITPLDGQSKYRDEQIIYKDKNVYLYTPNETTLNDSLIVNNYNDSEYQIALGVDSKLYSYKTKLNSKDYLINNNIKEISGDFNSDDPVILVKYENDSILAFNYYNGDKLFEYGDKQKISLVNYITSYFDDDNNISSGNASYDNTNDLITEINNSSDPKVLDILNTSEPGNASIESTSEKDITSESSDEIGIKTNINEYTKSFVSTYNPATKKYEAYNISDILDTSSEDVKTVDDKISSNHYLQSYFSKASKTDETVSKNKLYIYIGLIILIVINLIDFIRRLRMKEKKSE